MELLTVDEAAKIRNVTRQAIYLAIREGRLKPYMRGKIIKVSMASILELQKKKYDRVIKLFQGQEVFSDKEGMISVYKAAQLTGIPRTSIYNAIYSGRLKAVRKGKTWVIQARDLPTVQTYYLNRKKNRNSKEKLEKDIKEIKNLSK